METDLTNDDLTILLEALTEWDIAAINLVVINRELENAANTIRQAFVWRATPEGHDYWNSVVQRLEELQRLADETAASEPSTR